MAQFAKKCGMHLTVVVAAVVSAYAAQPVTEITLPGTRLFTESITSTKDGTLIVGSLGKANVSRIPYATTTVTEWINRLRKNPAFWRNQFLGNEAERVPQ